MSILIGFLILAVLFFAFLYNHAKGGALDAKIAEQQKQYEAAWAEHTKKIQEAQIKTKEATDAFNKDDAEFRARGDASKPGNGSGDTGPV